MAETDRYRTVGATASAEIEVKRSRFLCALRPALTEEEARQAIDEARRAHWDARHHCSAFVLGPRGDLRRSNDDGEPSGTAGMPILDALTGAELTNVVAVVTRWFGGTLLGTGGLVRAYGDAVRAALDLAVVEEYARMTLVSVGVDMADVGRVENALRTAGHLVEGGRLRKQGDDPLGRERVESRAPRFPRRGTDIGSRRRRRGGREVGSHALLKSRHTRAADARPFLALRRRWKTAAISNTVGS